MIKVADPNKRNSSGEANGDGLNILVIDDEQSFLTLMREVLSLDGHHVMISINGRDGVSAYKSYRPDLVFLDLVMPGMNGLQVLKAIRKFDDHAKIVVITGYGSVDLAVSAMQEGAVDFLEKVNYTKNMRQTLAEKITAVMRNIKEKD